MNIFDNSADDELFLCFELNGNKKDSYQRIKFIMASQVIWASFTSFHRNLFYLSINGLGTSIPDDPYPEKPLMSSAASLNNSPENRHNWVTKRTLIVV